VSALTGGAGLLASFRWRRGASLEAEKAGYNTGWLDVWIKRRAERIDAVGELALWGLDDKTVMASSEP